MSTRKLGVFSTLFFQLGAYSAIAQSSESNEIEVIEVLAQKQAYRGDYEHLDSPEASLKLNSKLIESTGYLGLSQVLDMSSSIARQNSLGGLWDSFSVRGFFGDEDVPSGYLVNGFNAGRGFSGPRDISGIEHVEVLKGPKAAIFGRGEPGGSINLITKKPSYETYRKVSLMAGSRNQRRVEGDFNSALSDSVAGRVIGFYQKNDSFRDTIEIKKEGVTGSFRYDQSERSVWSYELEYNKQEIPFDRGIIAPQENFSFLPVERFLGEPNDGPTETKVIGHQLQWQYELSDDWQLNSGVAYRETELDSLSSDAELSPARQKLLYDGQTLSRQHRQRAYDTNQYVARAELSGQFETAGFQHTLISGIDYDRFEFHRDYRVARPPLLSTNPTDEDLYAINIFNPVYGQYSAPPVNPVILRQQNQIATGIYLQDQIELTDHL